MEYNQLPVGKISTPNGEINSFIKEAETNIDWNTVNSFGDEWSRFDNFSEYELKTFGDDYFDIVTDKMINASSSVLDVGCGSGRWTKYLTKRVGKIEAIDPSEAVFTASKMLQKDENVRVTQASVDNIPFEDDSFDFVFSLGVLHHLPDTPKAINACVKKVKSGGHFLVYLYYALDNRGFFYKLLFQMVNLVRRITSSLPMVLRRLICDLITIFIYLPLSLLSRFLRVLGLPEKLVSKLPLSYYSRATFNIMRNDAYDRFGTPLEKRFSKLEIKNMLEAAGLTEIVFSDRVPYWHAVGRKA